MLKQLTHYTLAATLAFSASNSIASTINAEDEINQLIALVANSNCLFIRNGSEHNASDAAEHLKLKYRKAKRHAKSAEDFINNLASKSSFSGKQYTMQCGQETTTSYAWLSEELVKIRQKSHKSSNQS